MSRHAGIAAAVAAASVGAALLACDPYWSVAEVITLGPGVDPASYARFRIRAEPKESPDAGYNDGVQYEYRVDAGQVLIDARRLAFPLQYEIGRIGTQRTPVVRVTAMLLADPGGAGPVAGDALGTAEAALGSCGRFFDDYCGTADVGELQLVLVQ